MGGDDRTERSRKPAVYVNKGYGAGVKGTPGFLCSLPQSLQIPRYGINLHARHKMGREIKCVSLQLFSPKKVHGPLICNNVGELRVHSVR